MDSRTNAILLVGGNSQIGNALSMGIAQRLSITDLIRIVRTESSSSRDNELIYIVGKYSDFDYTVLAARYHLKAVVVSFGILQSGTSLRSSLEANISVNTFETLKTLEKLFLSGVVKPETEIHFTSSLLADFTRESVFGYATSKTLTEQVLIREIKPVHKLLYIWKLAFVESKMNSDRKPSLIRINLEAITKYAKIQKCPGIHYIPKFSKYPSILLKALPQLHRHIK
jgi:hypothetical protein